MGLTSEKMWDYINRQIQREKIIMGLTSEKNVMMDYINCRIKNEKIIKEIQKKWAIENPELYKEWKKSKNPPPQNNLITNYFKKSI